MTFNETLAYLAGLALPLLYRRAWWMASSADGSSRPRLVKRPQAMLCVIFISIRY